MSQPAVPRFTWETVSAGSAGPGPRSRHGLVYDRRAEAIVLFGGIVWTGGYRGRFPADTWELRDGVWWPIQSPEQPPGRYRAAMIYDEARATTVLFGGVGERGVFLDDTWTYADCRWRLRKRWWRRPPSPRCGHAMAYDEERRYIVLFGGLNTQDEPLGDTWIYDGAWRQTAGDGPPPRRYAALAYDPRLKGCVLHGGAVDDHSREMFGDAWLFRDDRWAPLPEPFHTDRRDDHGLAYHVAAGTLVMLEGLSGSRGLLTLSREGWTPAAVQPLHPRHQCSPLAWDGHLGGLVMHGGEVRHGGPQFDATMVLRQIAGPRFV